MLVFRQSLNRPLTAKEVDDNFKFLHITEWSTATYLQGEIVYYYDNETKTGILYECLVDHDQTAYTSGFSVTGTVNSVEVDLWKVIVGSPDSRNPFTGTWNYIESESVSSGEVGLVNDYYYYSLIDNSGVDWSDYFTYLNNLNLSGSSFLFQFSDPDDVHNLKIYVVGSSSFDSDRFLIPSNSTLLINNGTFDYEKDYHSSFIPIGLGGTGSTLPTPVIGSVTFTSPTCYDENNGSITINVSGGSGFFRFSIDGGSIWSSPGFDPLSEYTFTGITAGTYTGIYVEDQLIGPVLLPAITVTQPDDLILTYSTTAEVVSGVTSDGTITLYGVGGTLPYQYSINGGGDWAVSSIFTGLNSGSYDSIIKDANNCETPITSVNVNYDDLSLSLVSVSSAAPYCPGGTGSVTITISGGSGQYRYKYNSNPWTPSVGYATTQTQTFSGAGITAGSYTLYAEDQITSDIVSGVVTIVDPSGMDILPVTGTSKNCGAAGNATVQLMITGATVNPPSFTTPQVKFGSSGLWYNMTPTATPGTYTYLQSFGSVGTYSGTIYIRDYCTTGTTSYDVHKYTTVSMTPTLSSAPSCVGDDWEYNIGLFGGSGSYDVKVGVGSWTGVTSGMIIAIPQSGSISGSTETISYRDSNVISCSGTTIVNNSQVTALTVTTTGSTNPTCYGGTGNMSLSVTGGRVDVTNYYEYKLITGGVTGSTWIALPTTISGLSGGILYNVLVRRVGTTCTPVTLGTGVTLTAPAAVTISYDSATNPTTCSGTDGSIVINVSGGTPNYRYSVNGGVTYSGLIAPIGDQITVTGLTAGSITIYVKDSVNCMATSTVTHTLSAPTTPTLSGTYTAPTCSGDNATVALTAGGGTAPYTYSSDGSTYVTGSTFSIGAYTGSHLFYVKDDANCVQTYNVVGSGSPVPVTVSATPTPESTGGANDGTIAISFGGGTLGTGYTINVITGTTTLHTYTSGSAGTYTQTGLNPATYTVKITDGVGCNITTTAIVLAGAVVDMLYYFRYLTPSTYASPNIYASSGGSNLCDAAYTYTDNTYASVPFSTVINYYKTNAATLFGGGSINLSASGLTGTWNPSIPIDINFSGGVVGFNGILGLLVPSSYPILTNAHLFDISGAPTAITPYAAYPNQIGITPATPITIGGLTYNLYKIYFTSVTAATTKKFRII